MNMATSTKWALANFTEWSKGRNDWFGGKIEEQ